MQLSFFDAAGDVAVQPPVTSITPPVKLKKSTPVSAKLDYIITEADEIGAGGAKTKFKLNLEAIKTLRAILTEGRQATQEEQAVLVKYTGWGHTPQVFDDRNDKWINEREQLKAVLTHDEWGAASRSITNAHYTSPVVIQAKWEAMQRLGFLGGTVLEPAAGIGHYFGLMPADLRNQAKLHAVELDIVSGNITAQLYQSAAVQVKGLQEAHFDTEFDLIVSNVPFGNYPVHDPDLYYNGLSHLAKSSIHNYFFLKALSLARSLGVVAFITSSHTMDSVRYTNVREALAYRAQLLGAIRLPVWTFTRNAGTHVTTDIIFLQKKEEPGEGSDHPWLNLVELENGYKINEFFASNPEMMLGEMEVDSRRFKDKFECVAPKDMDIGQAIINAIPFLPPNIFPEPPKPKKRAIKRKDKFEPKERKPWWRTYSYVLDDRWRVWQQQENEQFAPVQATSDRISRIRDLVEVRDAFRVVLDANLNGTDAELEEAQITLSDVYLRFVAKHGYINHHMNVSAFSEDPDAPAIRALEDWNPDTGRATKARFFTERTIRKVNVPERVDNATDALAITLNEYGYLQWDRVLELLGKQENDLPDIVQELELEDRIYEVPGAGGWVYQVADEYLSGNVRQKLAEAQAAAKDDPRFERNVQALEAIIPRDLAPAEIYAPLGAYWIPDEYVEAFVNDHLFGEGRWYRDHIKIEYLHTLGKWSVDTSNQGWSITGSSANTKRWGTKRVKATKLIEQALQGKIPTVYDTITDPYGNEKQVKNEKATLAAREKQQLIIDEFAKWLWTDDDRASHLARLYNDRFNSYVARRYDGSHLVFPGMNPDITMRSIQKDVAWRIIQSKTTLMAHRVGFGKSISMIAAAMKMKQLGVANKVLIVTKKSTFEGFLKEAFRLYPNANILPVYGLSPADRKRMMARIATDDWDIILVTHQTFEKMPIKDSTRYQFYQNQLDSILHAKRQAEGVSLKELKKAEERIKAKLAQLNELGQTKDDALTLEESGINVMMVDESQCWKNLWFPTSMTRVPGIGGSESGRAFDGYIKTQWLLENGGKVIFATGTSIENSIAEMFTLKRFLYMNELKKLGLDHFDAWAGMFGKTVTLIEMKPDGSGFRQNRRFARFENVPELLRMFWQFADVQMDAEKAGLKIPALIGGQAKGVSIQPRHEMDDIIADLSERAENLSGKDPRIDNMLKIVSDAKKAALDLRVYDPAYGDHPDTKVNACVETVARIYRETTGVELSSVDGFHNLTQVIFLDMSTPNGSGWNVYQDIKDKLVNDHGIPAHEIVFAHEANTDQQRKLQQDRINQGEIRIWLASTEKGGIGVNIQRLLVAIHHLDCPWKPAEVEQREGRIVRQGNLNDEVYIFRYVTERTFDVYVWETVERKAKFIAQVMTGDLTVRSIEDIDDVVIGFTEMKALATGNTAIIDKVKVDTELRRLEALWVEHRSEQHDAQMRIKQRRGEIKKLQDRGGIITPVLQAVRAEGEAPLMALAQNLKSLCIQPENAGQRNVVAQLYGCAVVYNDLPVEVKQRAIKDFWSDGPDQYETMQRVEIIADGHFELYSFKLRQQADKHAERNAAQLHDAFKVAKWEEMIEKDQQWIAEHEREITRFEEMASSLFPHEGRIMALRAEAARLQKEIDELGKGDKTEAQAENAGGASEEPDVDE